MSAPAPHDPADDQGPGHSHGHSHGHGHGHGHGALGPLRHVVSDFFGGHSHDTADQVDDVLEATADGRRALYLSLLILMATAILQLGIVAVSGSVALLGDGLHNLADALTAVPLLIAFRLGLRAANDRFTYGYGRAEDVAGIFVVAMIALSSVVAAYEAVRRLVQPETVDHLGAVAAAAVVGFVGNEWVAHYRIRVGRRIGSAALIADGLHARADGITSLAVLLGVLGSAVGWRLADPIVGLLITLAILGVLRSAVAQVGGRLLDAVDPQVVASVRRLLGRVPGVVAVDEVRVRWIGHSLRAETVVRAGAGASLTEADRIAEEAGGVLRARVRHLSEVAVRVRSSES